MYLNSLKPALGSKKKAKRVGRGIGCTFGKTCGRGHKGQKSRSGGFHKIGFEGGQMPLQRRLPKSGFRSRLKRFNAEIRLHELAGIDASIIDLDLLKAQNIVPIFTKKAKVIDSGKLDRAVNLKGILVTRGARSVIEAQGGTVEI